MHDDLLFMVLDSLEVVAIAIGSSIARVRFGAGLAQPI
ncbi:hypothetical protein BSU04_25990 [Caballeronia sordidicola]|uniref:Uncharacterized protein n=1 Tax=Caballeronia sordidicola TaxID=196367 RepID=A0A226WWX5_CABSO|nr:hypothetical protein BSU04_25990 [Caballeronia sordidicola]